MKKKINYGIIKPFKPPKMKTIPIRFNFDTDKDGVPDWKDCRPFNPKKQHEDPDWMDTKKRRPKKEAEEDIKYVVKGIPFSKKSVENVVKIMDEYEEEELGIISMGIKFYKNYKINFVKYTKGHKVGTYPGHPQTDIYLPGLVYAHGFEQDPTSPWGEKYGETIGIGKTVAEAFREAKQWIDRYGK